MAFLLISLGAPCDCALLTLVEFTKQRLPAPPPRPRDVQYLISCLLQLADAFVEQSQSGVIPGYWLVTTSAPSGASEPMDQAALLIHVQLHS